MAISAMHSSSFSAFSFRSWFMSEILFDNLLRGSLSEVESSSDEVFFSDATFLDFLFLGFSPSLEDFSFSLLALRDLFLFFDKLRLVNLKHETALKTVDN